MATPLANLKLMTDATGALVVSAGGSGTVHVTDPVTGDGSLATPLGVGIDGVTITLVGGVLVAPSGGGGTIGGTAGTVDNRVVRADGTGGSTIQGSAVAIADTTGVITGTQGVTFTGATSGTTALIPTAIAGSTTLTLPAATDTLVGKATTDTLTNKTLTTPTIASFTNATHAHTNAAGGGQLAEGALALTDITTNNVTTSAHGFAPKGDNNAAHFLNGQLGWTTPAGSGTPQILAAYVSKTANYTAVVATDGVIEAKTNAFTLTLPTAASVAGQGFILINQQTANALTINTTGGQTLNGAASGAVTITNGALMVLSDGSNWVIGSDAGLTIPSLTSGGVIYASSTSALASSALLAAHAVVVGGGAGTAPNTLASAGTAGQLLVSGGASADPAFATNSIIVPVAFNMGATIAGTASLGVSTPSSGGATAATAATTVPPIGAASFSGSASNEVHCQFPLPSDWTAASAFDVNLLWRAAATTGNVVWQVASLFVGDGVVYNTAYNTASTVTDAAKGTTLQSNLASITTITASGTTTPAANKMAFFKILRDGGTGSDTMSGAAELISATFYYRRTPVLGA